MRTCGIQYKVGSFPSPPCFCPQIFLASYLVPRLLSLPHFLPYSLFEVWEGGRGGGLVGNWEGDFPYHPSHHHAITLIIWNKCFLTWVCLSVKEEDRGGEEGKRERVYFCFVYFIITPPLFLYVFFRPLLISFHLIKRKNSWKETRRRRRRREKKGKTPVGDGIINFNGLCSSLPFFLLSPFF